MKFVIEQDVLNAFPEVRIGVLALENVDNRSGERFAAELQRAREQVRSTLDGVNVTEHPRIRCWREAYRAFGAKPKKYPSSIENLVRRTLRGESLRAINPLVDLGNIVSLKHLLPVGGEDLDRVEGDIRLTRAGENEPAIQLLREKEERAPKVGEVIYTDARGAICRRWNWKRSGPHQAHRGHQTRGARARSAPASDAERAPRGNGGASGAGARSHRR